MKTFRIRGNRLEAHYGSSVMLANNIELRDNFFKGANQTPCGWRLVRIFESAKAARTHVNLAMRVMRNQARKKRRKRMKK